MSELIIKTLTIGENASKAYSIIFDGITTVSNPSVTVYKNESSDVTSTVMPSDSHTVSGNVLTMKPLVPTGMGGQTLTADIIVTADGNTEERFIRWYVAKQESGKVRRK